MIQVGSSRFVLPLSRPAGYGHHRSLAVQVSSRLVLSPVGDGSTSHIKTDPSAIRISAIDIAPGVFEVGRAEPADIVVAVPTVSGRHAMITVGEDGISIKVTDLGSTNGTFVNDEKLKELQSSSLAVGDKVCFGDPHLAAFRLEEAAEEEAPAAEQPAE